MGQRGSDLSSHVGFLANANMRKNNLHAQEYLPNKNNAIIVEQQLEKLTQAQNRYLFFQL